MTLAPNKRTKAPSTNVQNPPSEETPERADESCVSREYRTGLGENWRKVNCATLEAFPPLLLFGFGCNAKISGIYTDYTEDERWAGGKCRFAVSSAAQK